VALGTQRGAYITLYIGLAVHSFFEMYEKISYILCIWCTSDIFSERIVNVWNSLPSNVDFSTLTSFSLRRSIQTVDFAEFLRCSS